MYENCDVMYFDFLILFFKVILYDFFVRFLIV